MATWRCRQNYPGEKERNPITGEYFDEEAIDQPAQALVREAIQNILDARANGDALKVRFYISGLTAALPAERSARWLGEAWEHLRASDSGLRDVPDHPGSCPFLVVEDFSTIGLEGDPTAHDHSPSQGKNHFYAFFRAEGVSQNAGGRGKWGVGKTVFARSSWVNALFGLTVRRSDNQRLLMGQATLRFHVVANKKYGPDVMFGVPQSNDFVLPITDATVLDEFCRDFRVRRRDEPGLSVIVPYSHEEITPQAIAKAVAREYFYPILTGKLIVDIEGPELTGKRLTLDSNNLVDSIDLQERDIEGDLRSLIYFATWANTLPPNEISQLLATPGEQALGWSSSLFPKEDFDELATKFAQGKDIALRIPVTVRMSAGGTRESHFDLFLRQDVNGRGYPPVFIRNGIIIPKALERRVKGHHLLALVIIDDKPLADMLGDAETPAHTQWSHQTQNFRGIYRDGKACLDFVRSAPRQVAELLSSKERERDRLALADFFPRPQYDPELDALVARDGNKPGRPDVDPKPGLSEPFEIEQIRGGFCIRRTGRHTISPRPPRLEVLVAYDRSQGNPLTRYRRDDFDLATMRKDLAGVREANCQENRMVVDVLEQEFRIEVTGFDENRDIYVRAQPQENDE